MSNRFQAHVWASNIQPLSTRMVALALADAASDDGVCWMFIRTLADKSGVSEASVKRSLAAMKSMGLVVKDRRGRGQNQSSIFHLNEAAFKAHARSPEQGWAHHEPTPVKPGLDWGELDDIIDESETPQSDKPEPEPVLFAQPEPRPNRGGGGLTVSPRWAHGEPTHIEPSLEPKEVCTKNVHTHTTPKTTAAMLLAVTKPKPAQPRKCTRVQTPSETELADFGAFWDAYPNKVNKKRAEKAYVKAVRGGASPQLILDGVAHDVKHRFSSEKKYVPHPATWLNDERYAELAEQSALDTPLQQARKIARNAIETANITQITPHMPLHLDVRAPDGPLTADERAADHRRQITQQLQQREQSIVAALAASLARKENAS